MKDHLKEKLADCTVFAEAKFILDIYIDYYNNRHYQWKLAKFWLNEYFYFVITGVYLRNIPNTSQLSVIPKRPEELGVKPDNNLISSSSYTGYVQFYGCTKMMLPN